MADRIKVTEPVWSSNAGKENTIDQQARAEIENAMRRRRYRATNYDHEPSDCFNCAKGIHGVCVVVKAGQPLPSLEYCQKVYTNCQFWERIH